eukprot:Partr_v1_DN28371_c0_g1_i2_m78609 putative Chitin Synthase
MIALFEVSNMLFCKDQPVPYTTARKLSSRVIVNGKLVDYKKFTDSRKLSTFSAFGSFDVSASFPTFTVLGRLNGQFSDQDIAQCVGSRQTVADAWLSRRLSQDGYSVENSALVNCPLPNGSRGQCFFEENDRKELLTVIKGDVSFSEGDISARSDIPKSNVLVSLRGRVYDIGIYLRIATESNSQGAFRPNAATSFFADEVTNAMIRNAGGDMTADFEKLPDKELVQRCFNKLFYAGITRSTSLTLGCSAIQPVLYAAIALIMLILLPRHLMAFVMTGRNDKEGTSDAYVVALIHLTAEPFSWIRKTIESVALSTYRDSQKLLWIVCDGDLTCENGDVPTHELVLKLLGYQGKAVDICEYSSIGELSKAPNAALLYSGTYIVAGRRLPYVLIVKLGGEHESILPGSRGKRDTVAMLIGFFSRIMRNESLLSSLEYELFMTIKKLRFDPRRFEYALVINGGTVIEPSVPLTLVNRLDREELAAVASAKSEIANFAPLQGYVHYIDNCMSPLFKNALGVSTLVNSGCYMLRLKYSDGTPCLLSQDFMERYTNLNRVPQDLHSKQLAYQSEDEHIGVLMMLCEPSLKITFEPAAVVKIPAMPWSIIYDSFRVRHNSHFHAIKESLKLRTRYKFAGIAKLLSMMLLPSFTSYCYVLVVRAILSPYIYSSAITVVPLVFVHILSILSQLVRLNFKVVFSGLTYLLVGIPLYCIIFPVMAFLQMNTFTTVNMARSKGSKYVHAHPAFGKGLESASIQKMSLENWKSMHPVKPPVSQIRQSQHPANHQSPPLKANTIGANHTKAIPKVERKLPTITPRVDMNQPVSIANHPQTRLPRPPLHPPTILQNQLPQINALKKPSNHDSFLGMDRPDSIMSRPASIAVRNLQKAGNNRPTSTSSEDTIRVPIATMRHQTVQFHKAKMVAVQQPHRPMRAQSIVPSEYQASDYGFSTSRPQTSINRDTMMTTATNNRLDQNQLDDEELEELTGVSKQELGDEIHIILQDADLNTVTRREVKEALASVFGGTVEVYYNDFINTCIEEYTLEKLALI